MLHGKPSPAVVRLATRICWRLQRYVLKYWEPDARDAVCGDFSESGENWWTGTGSGVLGLVVRRQLALWNDWRPWLALLGLAGFSGVLLSEAVFHFDVALRMRLVGFNNLGLTDQEYTVYFLCVPLALFLWSWTSGFVLGSLSGRATWLTGALFYVVVLNSYWVILVMRGNIRYRPARTATSMDRPDPPAAAIANRSSVVIHAPCILGRQSRTKTAHPPNSASPVSDSIHCHSDRIHNVDPRAVGYLTEKIEPRIPGSPVIAAGTSKLAAGIHDCN